MIRPRLGRVPWGAALVVVAGALPSGLRAQTAAIPVDAEISSTLLSIANPQHLRFGAVVPGTPTVLDPRTSTTVGSFEIHGNRNAEVAVSMVLPTQLVVGPYTIPVAFGANAGCWRVRNQQNACALYDPSTLLVQRIRNSAAPNNTLFIWLGGTASPAVGQRAGHYTATITASVVYTGN